MTSVVEPHFLARAIAEKYLNKRNKQTLSNLVINYSVPLGEVLEEKCKELLPSCEYNKKNFRIFLQQKIVDCIAGAGAGAGAGDAILTSRVKMERLHNTPDD